jgi:hypothetical protein
MRDQDAHLGPLSAGPRQSYLLNGALVGTGPSPGTAVSSLLAIANALVIEGENGLTDGPIDLVDRVWLFKVLDTEALSGHEARYAAIRKALGHDPYGVCSCHPFSQKSG